MKRPTDDSSRRIIPVQFLEILHTTGGNILLLWHTDIYNHTPVLYQYQIFFKTNWSYFYIRKFYFLPNLRIDSSAPLVYCKATDRHCLIISTSLFFDVNGWLRGAFSKEHVFIDILVNYVVILYC